MPAFLRATTADSMQKGLGRVLYAKGFRKVMGWLVAILLILYFATFISWEAVYRVIRLREWNINRWKCLDFAEGMPAAADYSLVHSSTEGFYISHNFHPGIGLGNKLFIYASLWGIAARNDLRLAISRNTLHDIMHVSTSVVGQFDLSDCKNLVFGMEECCFYDSRSENLFSQTTIRNVSVWGYLQSWKYFHPHYREAIRHQFRFKQDVLDRADAVRTRILNEMSEKLASHENRSRPVVGVHIRRGDVLTSYHLKVGHVEIPAVFYENANRYLFEKGIVDPFYLVCTNDPEWAKENLPFRLMEVVNESAEVDLNILSRSNHLILSYGTFSFFAGYLSNASNVIYFADWPRPGSVLASMTNLSEYWVPEWIGLR